MVFRRDRSVWTLAVALPLLVLGLSGCSNDAGKSEDAESKSAAVEKGDAAGLSADSLAALAKADAVDGETDKVVARCLSCGLGMAGKAEHSTKIGAYELHLCSDHCKKTVEADPEKALASVGK
jgi:hypothetical protein